MFNDLDTRHGEKFNDFLHREVQRSVEMVRFNFPRLNCVKSLPHRKLLFDVHSTVYNVKMYITTHISYLLQRRGSHEIIKP